MLTINVTQEHIDKGVKHNSKACPIALALREALGATDELNYGVGVWEAYVRPKGQDIIEYSLDTWVQNWIDRFDAGVPVQPFTYEMRVKA